MAEGSGSNAAIWVAVITVVGSLLTAVVVNADKWLARVEKPVAMASPANAAPVATATPTPVAPTPTPAPTPSPDVMAEPRGAPAGLTGIWHDRSDETRFRFEQNGALYKYTQLASNDTELSTGRGSIKGTEMEGIFETSLGATGNCSFTFNAEMNRIIGTCVGDEGGWNVLLQR